MSRFSRTAEENTTVWLERIGYSMMGIMMVWMMVLVITSGNRDRAQTEARSYCIVENLGDKDFCRQWANVSFNYDRFR
jgi:hypothetical protein